MEFVFRHEVRVRVRVKKSDAELAPFCIDTKLVLGVLELCEHILLVRVGRDPYEVCDL